MKVKMELLAVSVVMLGFILNVAKRIELLSLPNYYSKNTDSYTILLRNLIDLITEAQKGHWSQINIFCFPDKIVCFPNRQNLKFRYLYNYNYHSRRNHDVTSLATGIFRG